MSLRSTGKRSLGTVGLEREGSGERGLGRLEREERTVALVGDRESGKGFIDLRDVEWRFLGGNRCSLDAIREIYASSDLTAY